MNELQINHIIDPDYFQDVLDEFGTYYDAFFKTDRIKDRNGNLKYQYQHIKVFGSLQSQGTSKQDIGKGVGIESEYHFYCMSSTRLYENDFIYYKKKLLQAYSVEDYDEYGVRKLNFKMVQLSTFKDLEEYIKILNGTIKV